ncbi:MAG: amidohydrolase [Peptoniphilaceae bacterium]|nr:amidohydrolase [Peptoniphilaceae bacterium]MDY6085928.1 amidohydrolase [Peptoniphilaceae bacterium]
MDIHEVASRYGDALIEKRRYFHQHPEVSEKEFNTSQVIQDELDAIGIPWQPCGLETGILATINGAKPGKTILLRGDMDALTVQETTGAPYASQNEGVMHACGHDCHISMLLTAARILNDMKEDLCGTVKLAFQPAEEVATGAKAMIADGALEGVDACFAIHVWAGVAAGTISLEAGPRMASADEFHIKVKGKGSHGAEPESGIDAAVVTAAMINNLQTIASREISPMEPVVVTVGTIQAGTRWNVIAENSVMTGTVRCFNPDIWASMKGRLERVVSATAEAYRAQADLEYINLVVPTVNDPAFVSLAQQSAKKVMGDDCLAAYPPTTGGEDFSFFLQKVPGAIAFLGTGSEACDSLWPNHSGNFRVDESQLIKGAMLYAQVALDYNAQT